MQAAAHLAATLAEASGRPVRQILGKVAGWRRYVEGLSNRADAGYDAPELSALSAAAIVGGIQHGVTDMARAFAVEVIGAALMTAGGTAPEDGKADPGEDPADTIDGAIGTLAGEETRSVLIDAALRTLLGEGTLPALVEKAGRWHVRSDAIARYVAGLADGVIPDGPALFGDVSLGKDTYLTLLRSVRDVLDEGAAGPDANGVVGMNHCVGSLAIDVAHGRTAILSVRRRVEGGFVRISTVQVDFSAYATSERARILQHYGPGNAPVPAGLHKRVVEAVNRVAPEAHRRGHAFRREYGARTGKAAVIAGAGAWEAVRDLWAFALPRPMRTLGPIELLSAIGLGEAGPAEVPDPRAGQ